MKRYSWKLAGLVLFLGFVLQPAIQQFLSTPRLGQATVEAFTHDERLACISNALPERGEVGFLYGADAACATGDDACTVAYYQTAYYLAPRVIIQGSDTDWVIVQPNNSVTVQQIEAGLPLKLVTQCGNRFWLFKRVNK